MGRTSLISIFLLFQPVLLSAGGLNIVKRDSSATAKAGFRFENNLVHSPICTAPVQTFLSGDLDFSPQYDFRYSLMIVPGARIIDNGAPGYNVQASFMDGNTFMIDGLIMDPTRMCLSNSEIRSITTVGNIVDRFKSGMGNGFQVNTNICEKEGHFISARFETAFLFSGRSAEWCNGAEYAEMMNQARINSGLPELYSSAQIEGFRKGDPLSLEYPCVDLREKTIKDWRTSQKLSVSMSGKEGRTSYFTVISYSRDGDNLKIGPVSDYNSLNVRGNVKTNFTRNLSLEIRSALDLTFRRSPNAGFNIGASIIPPVEFPLTVGKDGNEGQTIYGVSKQVPDSYYAALLEGGSRTARNRAGTINATLGYNFNKLLPGLSAETYVGFLMSGTTTDGSTGDYLGYYLDQASGNWLPSAVHQGAKSSAKTVMSTYYNHLFELKETIRYSYWRGANRINAAVWGKLREYQYPGTRDRSATISASCDYSYRNRYMAQAVLFAPGTSMYKKSERFACGFAAGIGWVLSNEEWLRRAKGVDHLKIMAQAGFGPLDVVSSRYLFLDSYVKSGSYASGVSGVDYSWIAEQGNSLSKPATKISRLANSSLGRGRQTEINAGIEGSFLGNRLGFSASFVYIHNTGLLTDGNSKYPDFYGMKGITTYINWNRTTSYLTNFGLDWGETRGKVRYEIGYWLYKSLVLRDRYLETVINDYNKTEGTYTTCLRGYTYLGKFSSEEEINSSPVQTFDARTHVGDLKYKDIDGNGTIDGNDVSVIVKDAGGIFHTLRFNIGFGNFNLLTIFRARTGSTINLLTCNYYGGGRGYVNYTKWMRENLGGAYPRLAYEGNNGNFVTSGFWLRSGDFLKLANLELSYTFPKHSLRLFLRGENLFCIDRIKDLDPEYLTAGYSTYAINRTVSLGINIGIR